jgi:hypothetical protein
MMSSPDKSRSDDRLLTLYLLGALPAEEAERLDELSIADEEIAARLSALENDLVDAYVRGEVSGEDRERFESVYMASPRRREKVQFARALWKHESPSAAIEQASAIAPQSGKGSSASRTAFLPRFALQSTFGAAAAILLFVAGYLLLENQRLKKETGEAQTRLSIVDQREQQVQKALNEQQSATARAVQELEQLRAARNNLDQLNTVSVLLAPPTRGASPIPTVSVRRGTDLLVLLLTLDSDDFPGYRVALKDPATNQVLWRSGPLAAAPAGPKQAVSVAIHAAVLKQQTYIAELTGVPSRGASEVIGGYAFRAVLK